MGRETVTVCHWDDQIAEVRLHLDSKALQLRGDIRADIDRQAIDEVMLQDAGFAVQVGAVTLTVEMNAPDAARWQKALLKKPPTLAEKLGIAAQSPAYVIGAFDDAPLAQALDGASVDQIGDASVLVAVLLAPDHLPTAAQIALDYPGKHIWMVHEKGKSAAVGDTQLRTHMRSLGFIDSKTSAVSDRLTATRYRLRVG